MIAAIVIFSFTLRALCAAFSLSGPSSDGLFTALGGVYAGGKVTLPWRALPRTVGETQRPDCAAARTCDQTPQILPEDLSYKKHTLNVYIRVQRLRTLSNVDILLPETKKK